MVLQPKPGTSFRRAQNWTRRTPAGRGQFRRGPWILLATLLTCGLPTAAQVRSNIAGVNLAANLGDSISVSASPGQLNFALVSNGVATGNPTLTVTTAWVFAKNETVNTYAYFSSPTAALSDGAGHNIPSSSVSGNVNGAGFQTFGACLPYEATACLLIVNNDHVTGRPRWVGSINSTVQLQISTVGLSLQAGTYVGVLNIRAQAI